MNVQVWRARLETLAVRLADWFGWLTIVDATLVQSYLADADVREKAFERQKAPEKGSLTRYIVRTFWTQVGCQIISILAGIVVARSIGPSGRGFASYAIIAVSLVCVLFYGFADAVLSQFGRERYSARAVHAISLRIMLVALAIIMPVFVAISVLVPSQRPLAAAAIALPFAIYMQILTPFLMVSEKIALLNGEMVTRTLGTAALTVILLTFTHLGLSAVIGVWILFYAIGALRYAHGLRPILVASSGTEGTPGLLRGQLTCGFRCAGAFAGFLNIRIGVIVVSIMLSPADLGWYVLALASGEMLWQASRAFSWSALGRIGADPLPQAAALVARLTRNVLAIVGILSVVAFAVGPWLIVHVYGVAFAPAGSVLRWALPGIVALAAEPALEQFAILQLARPTAVIWIQSVAAAVCAVLTIATTGRYGIVAAAASMSLTCLVVMTALATIFVRATGIPLKRLLLVQREDLGHYAPALSSALRTLTSAEVRRG
jgi:O-antigen/teichoic acid export membrane protein